jgi:UDP-N-acetylglucosamine 3-dehydrogenase
VDRVRMAIIGCGRHEKTEGATGCAQGHKAMLGYRWIDEIDVVAAADIRQDNLDLFCDEHSIPNRFTDYRRMLKEVELDAVTITTWPGLHAEMTVAAAQAGVRWVHCEKPMATTFGDAKAMVRACDEAHCLFTINHEYRYGRLFPVAKRLLDHGFVGDLVRVETFTSNLFDMGTHYFDLMLWYNNQEPVEWVMGQIDASGGHAIFAARVEGQGISLIKWRNGVYGLMMTGAGREDLCQHRLVGTRGVIEVGVAGGPPVRFRSQKTGGEWVEVPEDPKLPIPDGFWPNPHLYRPQALDMAALALGVVDALRTGQEPMCSGHNALQGDELIFATYESSRRRGRVDLPLEVEDNPYVAMLDAGMLPTRQ